MEKRTKSFWCIAGVAAISFALVVFAASGARAQQPQRGGILKIIDVAEGSQPIGAPWELRGIDTKLVKPVFEGLIREDANGKYSPWLATSWKVDAAKGSITLNLRKGVKFHDGTEFNAKAVKFTIDQSIATKRLTGVVNVDIIDNFTVRVNMEKYQNNILNTIATTNCDPVSPTAYEKMGKDKAMWNPVGTGPFKFVSYERGNKLVYKKWEGYWQKGLPYLDGIEYLFIRDPMTQQAAMRASGAEKVHVLCVTSGEEAAMLKAQGFEVLTMSIGPISLIPDSKNNDSPLARLKVRQAISYAINREAIVKARGFGFWKVADQMPTPTQDGFVKGLTLAKYDPKMAKRLLAEAGYPDGFKIKIIVMPAMVDRDAMVAVQRFLSEVGIQVELEFPDGGGYSAYRFKDGWKNALLAQHTRMLATTNISYNFYWLTMTGQWPSLKRPDNLVEKIESSLGTATQEPKRVQELTKMIADDMMIIPLYYVYEMYVIQKNVHNTGYCEWGSSTVNTPEVTWLSK